MSRLLETIDFISEWSGKFAGFLILPVIGVITYEVVARYGFDAPTLWSAEVVTFLVGPLYIFGGVYTLYVRGHINVDPLYNLLSGRGRTITRITLHFPLFALYIGIMLWSGTDFAWGSIMENERSGSGWNPIIWPIKVVLPVGVLLMMLQGLSQFIHDIRILLGMEEPLAEDQIGLEI